LRGGSSPSVDARPHSPVSGYFNPSGGNFLLRTEDEGRLSMAKGYWIGRVDVNNEDGFKPYAAANQPIFKKFGGHYLVRAGKFDVAEGHTRSRNVVVEFPDYAAALACYRSPEYPENIKIRLPHSTVELVVIEGYDGPQP
jgi:uncharacterized protein (DUF1330 family)